MAEPAYYLVQFEGAVQPDWRQAVAEAGGEIVAYVPENAFKVRLTGAETAVVANLPYVHWIGRFLPTYKLSPELEQDQKEAVVQIILEETADQEKIAQIIASSGARIHLQEGAIWRVVATYAQLQTIAAIEEVAWIEPYHLPKLHNEYGAGVIVGTNAANANGYDGSSQIVAVADTGLGGGTAATAHPDIPSSRIVAIQSWLGSVSDFCFTLVIDDGAVDAEGGHGTHVAVSAVGDGGANGEGKGAAPAAGLVFQAFENLVEVSQDCQDWYGYPPAVYLITGLPSDLNNLFQAAYDEGARIHANSWGEPSGTGRYRPDSAEADTFIWNHPDMLITFAAGNEGADDNADGVIDNTSVGAPATAKNVLAVGANENDRQGNYQCDTSLSYLSDDDFQAGETCSSMGGNQNGFMPNGNDWDYLAEPLASDLLAGNREQMAWFSSRGPTADGRIKPDVVAPGTWVLSGYSELYQQGYGDPVDPNTGYYQDDGLGMPFNDAYKYNAGTSMANPIAAGAAAVVRDFYSKAHSHAASAALVKATIINSAVDLLDENNDGVNDNDFPIPNVHEGWGLVNAEAATDDSHQFVDNTTGINTGATSSYQFTTTMANLPLKVTLVWSDYPSTPAAGVHLVNNLNLRVTDPAGTAVYLGNNFSGGWSTTGGSADTLNNVENVYVQSAAIGTWTVEVIGANIPQGPQPFALIVDGAFATGCQLPTTVNLTPTDSNITLDWANVPGTIGYEVWWADNDPYFAPGANCAAASNCALVADNTFTHSGVVYDPDHNITYLVFAGNCTAPSNPLAHWGIFNFNITPGSP
ncbi:MAG: S8 family serine peptidase [Ardenticatenaceae bacterium]|nr:S8 family serine peptidase [Ardenticatenaceae bacterium]